MTFEEKFKKAICNGISQKELANRSGLSAMTVSNIWLGKYKPSKKTVLSIERAIEELEKERGIK